MNTIFVILCTIALFSAFVVDFHQRRSDQEK
jgi:hypothetical protein